VVRLVFENQVNSIISNHTNSGHQMGFLWQGPVSDPQSFNDGITCYTQASAEDALVAGLSLGHNGTALAGIAGFCLDDYGSGRIAVNQIDIWGCNSGLREADRRTDAGPAAPPGPAYAQLPGRGTRRPQLLSVTGWIEAGVRGGRPPSM
jgi:hypothetical protein